MKISFIIPTLNRDKLLDRTLLSIHKQQTKREFEVIVIDNGSTDSTKAVCDQYLPKIENLVYHYDSTPGLLSGRHKGTEISKNEILCFLDDDVELNKNYVENLYLLFTQNNHIKLATGPCLPQYEVTPPDWLNYFWDKTPNGSFCHWLSLLDLGNNEKTVHPNFVWGLNFCIRKEVLLELNGFHPDCVPSALQKYQGDGETGLTMKAADQNYIAVYHPGLSLKHYVSKERLTVEYFKKRAFYEGVSKSFTNLRTLSLKPDHQKNSFTKKIKDILWPYYYRIINFRQILSTPREPNEIKEMRSMLNKCEIEGYKFHQKHFTEDETVRNWVNKSHFWKYNYLEQ
jgi:glycosyltransferase involved in cell wall biosynthesis